MYIGHLAVNVNHVTTARFTAQALVAAFSLQFISHELPTIGSLVFVCLQMLGDGGTIRVQFVHFSFSQCRMWRLDAVSDFVLRP